MSREPIPLLVAHRGYMHRYPENTWRSLQAAALAGACWVEFDIQMCADRRFVLLHDDTFERTAGAALSVFDSDSDAEFPSVHEPSRLGQRFEPTPTPTLVETLQQLATFPGTRAMVELKQESIDRWGLDSVMNNLLPLLEQHREQCCLISFNREALQHCRTVSRLDTGWVLENYDQATREEALRLQPDFLICNQTKVARGADLWPGDWQWMLYDIMDADNALDWARRGAALIETADIGGLLEHPLLASRRCHATPPEKAP